MAGAGAQALGTSPVGLGSPDDDPLPRSIFLRNAWTGEPSSAQAVHPVTGDYVLDENGYALGISSAQQLVLVAVKTAKGSSAMRELGHDLASIKVITPDIERRLSLVFDDALAHLTSRRIVELLSVDVHRLHPGAITARIRWRDLTTLEEHTTVA